jgi:hypothetical protein
MRPRGNVDVWHFGGLNEVQTEFGNWDTRPALFVVLLRPLPAQREKEKEEKEKKERKENSARRHLSRGPIAMWSSTTYIYN